MFRRKAVRWLLALVVVVCGAVFGLPDLGRAQFGGPAGTGKPSPVPWDPMSFAPPPDAVASRDLPLVDEGPGGGKVEPVSPLPFERRTRISVRVRVRQRCRWWCLVHTPDSGDGLVGYAAMGR